MTLDEFRRSIERGTMPSVAPLLRALWLDARGDWDGAHALAQEIDTADGAWVHAYLHRKEGDQWNAGYWYRRAGRPAGGGPLDDEWAAIVAALL